LREARIGLLGSLCFDNCHDIVEWGRSSEAPSFQDVVSGKGKEPNSSFFMTIMTYNSFNSSIKSNGAHSRDRGVEKDSSKHTTSQLNGGACSWQLSIEEKSQPQT